VAATLRGTFGWRTDVESLGLHARFPFCRHEPGLQAPGDMEVDHSIRPIQGEMARSGLMPAVKTFADGPEPGYWLTKKSLERKIKVLTAAGAVPPGVGWRGQLSKDAKPPDNIQEIRRAIVLDIRCSARGLRYSRRVLLIKIRG
jgi:hypothetical protein